MCALEKVLSTSAHLKFKRRVQPVSENTALIFNVLNRFDLAARFGRQQFEQVADTIFREGRMLATCRKKQHLESGSRVGLAHDTFSSRCW